MKQASEPMKSDLFSDQSTDYFEDMFLNEVSHFIASRQSLGLGKWIDETMNARQSK
jgi:Rod binding domain-containing protein